MIKTTEIKVDKIGLTCCDTNTNKKISNITLNPTNPQFIYEGLINKEFDYIKIPTKNCIDFETSCENPYALPKNNLSFVGNPIFEKENKKENKKEKEKNKIMDLLKLYEEYQMQIIEKKYDKQIDELLEIDPLVLAANEYNEKIKLLIDNEEIQMNYLLDVERVITKENANERNKIIRLIKEEKRKITEKIEIVRAHLELAETFLEKQQILKTYNIIDENGKLIVDNIEEEPKIKVDNIKEEPKIKKEENKIKLKEERK